MKKNCRLVSCSYRSYVISSIWLYRASDDFCQVLMHDIYTQYIHTNSHCSGRKFGNSMLGETSSCRRPQYGKPKMQNFVSCHNVDMEQFPQPNNADEESENDQEQSESAERHLLAKELFNHGEAFQFSGIAPEDYERLKQLIQADKNK